MGNDNLQACVCLRTQNHVATTLARLADQNVSNLHKLWWTSEKCFQQQCFAALSDMVWAVGELSVPAKNFVSAAGQAVKQRSSEFHKQKDREAASHAK